MSQHTTKPTKWHKHPAKTQISLGTLPVWSESSLSTWRKLGSEATHWMHSEDWSDWADANADLSLRWAHICRALAQIHFSKKKSALSIAVVVTLFSDFSTCQDLAMSLPQKIPDAQELYQRDRYFVFFSFSAKESVSLYGRLDLVCAVC